MLMYDRKEPQVRALISDTIASVLSAVADREGGEQSAAATGKRSDLAQGVINSTLARKLQHQGLVACDRGAYGEMINLRLTETGRADLDRWRTLQIR